MEFPPSPAEHRPSPEVLDDLRCMCAEWLGRAGEFDEHFDANLALLAEGAGVASAGGLDACRALVHAVVHSLAMGEDTQALELRWHALGAVHAAYGFPDDGYAAVGRALIHTGRDLEAENWGSSLSSSLAALHLWMVGHLTAGADRGRPAGPATAGPATAVVPVSPDAAGRHPGTSPRPATGPASEAPPDPPPGDQDGMPRVDDIIGMVLGGSGRPRRPRRKGPP